MTEYTVQDNKTIMWYCLNNEDNTNIQNLYNYLDNHSESSIIMKIKDVNAALVKKAEMENNMIRKENSISWETNGNNCFIPIYKNYNIHHTKYKLYTRGNIKIAFDTLDKFIKVINY